MLPRRAALLSKLSPVCRGYSRLRASDHAGTRSGERRVELHRPGPVQDAAVRVRGRASRFPQRRRGLPAGLAGVARMRPDAAGPWPTRGRPGQLRPGRWARAHEVLAHTARASAYLALDRTQDAL